MKVAILGLGVDTADVIPWLEKRGDQITILDEKRGDKFENLDKYDLIVRSPGVYRFRSEIVAAEKAGVKISSKTKLFFDACPAKIIGVTGTKGKGTTATLIYEMLKSAGKKVFLGGNIGSGMFGILGELGRDDWVILELSSFQLIDLHKSPHIAVVLMVTSEHLDWHSNVKDYIEAKKPIAAFQARADFAVINKDYPTSVAIGSLGKGQKIWVSGKDMINTETRLRGEHNKENIAAAVAVAEIVGVSREIIQKTVALFKGLEHRLEEVAIKNGVTFYNDSFSTTPETAIAAIKSFSEPEIVILGGSSKNSDFSQLVKMINSSKNIKLIIQIGLEGPRIVRGIRGIRVIRGEGNMAGIVKMAYNKASPGDIVLLSPACASFDMFKNYKDRGNQFKEQVRLLKDRPSRT